MNSGEMHRRSFMKIGSGVLAAGLAPTVAEADERQSATEIAQPIGAALAPDPTPYPVKWYPFTLHADSDNCWSLSVGPDGRIYAAACAESVPGGVVKPVRYNERRDDLDYLFNLAETVEDPADSGR